MITINSEEAEVEWFYEDLQQLLELTPKKRSFSSQGIECKVESQEIPRVTGKFGLGVQIEAGLTEFRQKNTPVIEHTPSQQHKRQLYTWTSPGGQYQNQIDYILCS